MMSKRKTHEPDGYEDGVYRLLSWMNFSQDGRLSKVNAGTLIYARFVSKQVMIVKVLDGPHKGVCIRSVTVGDPETRRYLEPVSAPLLALAAVTDEDV